MDSQVIVQVCKIWSNVSDTPIPWLVLLLKTYIDAVDANDVLLGEQRAR